jgi:hypothetical protein
MLCNSQLTEQLARAQLLLQEHKAAKRLKGLLVSITLLTAAYASWLLAVS